MNPAAPVTRTLGISDLEQRIGRVARRHDRRHYRPGDADGRIVPADPALEARGVRRRDHVQHLRIVSERDEAVSQTLGYEKRAMVRRAQLDAEPAPRAG